jgi:hypothetical protein
VGGSIDCDESYGMRIFETTWPVDDEAAFTRPSVPAEYRTVVESSQ